MCACVFFAQNPAMLASAPASARGVQPRQRGAGVALAPLASMLSIPLLLLGGSEAHAGEALRGSLSQEQLTGSWRGARERLAEYGVSLEVFYTLDLLGNAAGGVDRDFDTLGNVDLLLTLELEPLLGWRGARAFLYGLGNHGDSVSADVGDLQGVSNIEAFPTWKLFEAWLEQDFCDGRASMLAGLYDVNSEFDVVPAASLFVHSSPGTGAELGLSGRNGPSIFPTTSLGARLDVRPTEELYLRVVAADGVPGDPNDPRGTVVRFDDGDGAFFAAEAGFYTRPTEEPRGRTRRQEEQDVIPVELRDERVGKYALGVWGYTGEFDDFVRVDAGGRPLQRTGSFGIYAFAERALYLEPEDPSQHLSVFVRLGYADRRTNTVDGYVGGGTVYQGLLPGRPTDRIGLSVAAAHFGRDFRQAQRLSGVSTEAWEVALELTYRAVLTSWLAVQPDLQVVVHPGGDAALDTAVVSGLRFVIGF